VNHLTYNLIDSKTHWSTVRCLKKFGEREWSKTLQRINEHLTEVRVQFKGTEELEQYYKEIIQSIPNSIYYGDFSYTALPPTEYVNDLKNKLPDGIKLMVATKVEGSIWNPSTERRQQHQMTVLRLQHVESTAVMDFKQPGTGDNFINFYKFELDVARQSEGLGKQVFPVLCKLLMDSRDVDGLESPVLDSPNQQPVFDDHRDNWRFQPAASGESKLYEWWTKRGGIAIDRDDTNRLYFMRFKYACDWIADHPEQARLAQASFGAPIYGEQQQATLNDLITAVSVAA
jgi:hypothetical protein